MYIQKQLTAAGIAAEKIKTKEFSSVYLTVVKAHCYIWQVFHFILSKVSAAKKVLVQSKSKGRKIISYPAKAPDYIFTLFSQ